MTDQNWQVGQRAVIDRRTVVTIDRVTSSGRAIVGDRTFDASGRERMAERGRYNRPILEPLTPEIEAGMALVRRGIKAALALDAEIEEAHRWRCKAYLGEYCAWNPIPQVPRISDVEAAERLAAAIQQVMGDTQ